MTEKIPVTVISGEEETTIEVGRGETLRDALLERGFPSTDALTVRQLWWSRALFDLYR